MSEQLPVVEVPESTWLRALAHALDPEAEPAGDDLLADDDDLPVAADASTADTDDDDDDDSDDGRDDGGESAGADDNVDDGSFNEDGQLWSDPIDADAADGHDHGWHDDGIG